MSFRECYFSVFSISLFFIEITRQISGHDGFISTGTANLISSPTFHRSRRPAYREYLSIKSPLSRLISGLRFRQNRQVGQVYPTSRLSGPDFFGTHLPKNEKYPRDSISREFPTSYPLSISPFPVRTIERVESTLAKIFVRFFLIIYIFSLINSHVKDKSQIHWTNSFIFKMSILFISRGMESILAKIFVQFFSINSYLYIISIFSLINFHVQDKS